MLFRLQTKHDICTGISISGMGRSSCCTSPMLRAYRLIITNYSYAPPRLWEWQQPQIDNLSRGAPTFGHHMRQRFFLNEDALNRENTRIWRTHYKQKTAHNHIAS